MIKILEPTQVDKSNSSDNNKNGRCDSSLVTSESTNKTVIPSPITIPRPTLKNINSFGRNNRQNS